jgi:type IV secretory pathway TrbD component
MGLLPWGLARILGITVYLDIPAATAWFAAGFGLVIAVAGVLLALPYGRVDRRAEPEAEVSADLMS